MKTKLMAAVMAATALTTSVAFAKPVEYSGDLGSQYNWGEYDGEEKDGSKFYFRLNARGEINKDVAFFARLAGEALTGDKLAADSDFNPYKYGKKFLALDRFGLEFKGKDFTYTVGRQGAFIGATGLLYSTERFMGSDAGAIDGLTVKGKAGVTDLKLVVGRQWNTTYEDDKLYVLQATYNPAPNWTLGGVLARYDYEYEYDYDHTHHWAVNVGYTQGKAGFVAEYANSNANEDDAAYAIGANYTFDDKNSAYIFYSRVEWDSVLDIWSEFNWDAKGIKIGYDYKLNKDTTLNFLYKDMEELSTGKDYEVFRAGVKYKF